MRHNRFSPTVREMNNMHRAKMMEMMKHAAVGYDYTENGGSTGEAANSSATTARLPIDIWTENDIYMLRANLPGFSPDDVEITFEDGELTLRAAHALAEATNINGAYEEVKEDGPVYLRREIFTGAYERTLTFNSPVDADSIEADFDNGVLTVSVPKAEEAKPKQIVVNAKSKSNKKK